MTLTLLTGPGEGRKRDFSLNLKGRYSKEAVTAVDLKVDSFSKCLDQVGALSLFEQNKRLLVVENVADSLDLHLLSSNNPNLDLLLLTGSSKESSVLIKSARELKTQVLNFEGEEETSAFPYLDFLIEGKAEAFVELKKLLAEYGGIYTLSMVYYLLRRNVLPLPKSSFAAQKIERQKKKILNSAWEEIYRQVLEIEFKVKSGLISEELGLFVLTEGLVGGRDWRSPR